MKQEGFEAIAIAFLFSFKNPKHELEAAEYLAARLPGVPIGLSHLVSPEWREFERTSTTVMNSYLAPVVRGYPEDPNRRAQRPPARRPGPARDAVQRRRDDGGDRERDAVADAPFRPRRRRHRRPARSPPRPGRPNLICIDMGGTSFDASLIIDGLPSGSNQAKLEGLPVQMSVVDIHVIGAGGGSIAWEEAGAMRVGPQSAGSMPGARMLRAGRDRAHGLRRQSRARPPRRRELLRRCDGARPRCGRGRAAGASATCSG